MSWLERFVARIDAQADQARLRAHLEEYRREMVGDGLSPKHIEFSLDEARREWRAGR